MSLPDAAYKILPGGGLYKRALEQGGGGGVDEQEIIARFAQDFLFSYTSGVTNPLTEEEAELAKQTVDTLADQIRIVALPYGQSAYLVTTLPEVPQWIEDKATERGIAGGAWNWAVNQLLSNVNRLNEWGLEGFSNVISTLLSTVVPGTTYYYAISENDLCLECVTVDYIRSLTNARKRIARFTITDIDPQPDLSSSGFTRIDNESYTLESNYEEWQGWSKVSSAVTSSHPYLKLKSSTYFDASADVNDASYVYMEFGKTVQVPSSTSGLIDGREVKCLAAVDGDIVGDVYYWIQFCKRLAYCFIDLQLCKQKLS